MTARGVGQRPAHGPRPAGFGMKAYSLRRTLRAAIVPCVKLILRFRWLRLCDASLQQEQGGGVAKLCPSLRAPGLGSAPLPAPIQDPETLRNRPG